MKSFLASVVLATALSSPAFAQHDQQGQDQHQGHGGHVAAPAPLLGAGIPGIVTAIGFGVYWLVRRRRPLDS